jgi:hypothetical protein
MFYFLSENSVFNMRTLHLVYTTHAVGCSRRLWGLLGGEGEEAPARRRCKATGPAAARGYFGAKRPFQHKFINIYHSDPQMNNAPSLHPVNPCELGIKSFRILLLTILLLLPHSTHGKTISRHLTAL